MLYIRAEKVLANVLAHASGSLSYLGKRSSKSLGNRLKDGSSLCGSLSEGCSLAVSTLREKQKE